MNAIEAAEAVQGYLCSTGAVLASSYSRETPPGFRIAVQQTQPELRPRVFEVMPLETPDCWGVLEVEAA